MANYNLIFQGEIVAGASLEEVKANLARLFKADAAKTATLFSGKAIIIKRNLDSDATKKYLAVLKKAGALVKAVKVEPEPSSNTHPESNPSAEQNAGSTKSSSTSLSPGLASLISYNRSSETGSADDTDTETGLQLAPLGAYIPNLEHKHNDIIIPDLGHLSMSDAESGSLDEFTQKPEPVKLPDIENLSMSAANEGSLEEFAVKKEPVAIPDISRLNIAEQDESTLSAENSRAEAVSIPDISGLSMSEAQQGSLEGIEKKPEPVQVPDISHLSVEETEADKPQGKAVFQIN